MSAPKEQLAGAAAASLEAHIARLRRYFAKRVPVAQIDDLIQEVFLRTRGGANDPSIEHLDRYLFTVAASILTDRARRQVARRDFAHETLRESHYQTEEITPERVLIGREALERTIAAIADLPWRTRDVFVLHRFEEMTCAMIAAQLGISVSAVEKHIMRALRQLHSRLDSL